MRELIIARGDAPEILEPSEAALDNIAVLIGLPVVPDALFAVGFARDDGTYFLLFEKGAKRRSSALHDPAQNQPVVFAARPRLVCRQMRRDLRPLLIVEPKQMRFHRLSFADAAAAVPAWYCDDNRRRPRSTS